jgi:hypothetical protein
LIRLQRLAPDQLYELIRTWMWLRTSRDHRTTGDCVRRQYASMLPLNTADLAVELYEPSLDGELAAAERRLACV